MHLRVIVSAQRLDLVAEDGKVARSFAISTARKGTGCEPDSHQTPLGWHRVCEKIGDDAPAGTQFVGRKPTGRIWKPTDPREEKNLVLTRILWLDGEEPHNRTSKNRYIYIHGTNREDLIGQPASAGCICLNNHDVIELYGLVPAGTRVEIVA